MEGGCEQDLCGLDSGPVVGPCESGKEPLSALMMGNVLITCSIVGFLQSPLLQGVCSNTGILFG